MDRKIIRSSRQVFLRPIKRYVVLGILLLGGVSMWYMLPASDTLVIQSSQLTVATVTSAPFQDYLPVRAVVAPLTTTFVNAVQGGEVKEVLVHDGAVVKKGDILARLSNSQLQLDVTTREAQIASQLGVVSAQRLTLQQTRTSEEGALSEARYALLKAQRELQIHQQLHDQQFDSDANLRSFHDEVEYETKHVQRLAEARVHDNLIATRQAEEIDQEAVRLRSNLSVVEASLDSLIVRAPVDGRLTNFDLQPGQSLKAGDKIGQIDSEGKYRLDADIDEFYLARIVSGEKGTAESGGNKLPVTISHVHPQVNNGQFRAELTFNQPPSEHLQRGESIEVHIILGETQNALVLPSSAWLEASGGTSAFLVSRGGKSADRLTITSGRRNPDQVEILNGLHEGDRVITSSYTSYKKFDHLIIR
ncbi:efflux RND transporter periplasmic adaptor subunit [Acetobacter thailandicus]|nr:efflux RND transporter periplasmic adaptor subunit [Acetobacter thailandicus]